MRVSVRVRVRVRVRVVPLPLHAVEGALLARTPDVALLFAVWVRVKG